MAIQVIDKAWISCTQGTCPTRLHATPQGFPGGMGAGAVLAAHLAAKAPPLNGIHAKFDAAGKLMSTATFANGAMHGASAVYNAAGGVSQKLMYAHGKLQGGAEVYGEGGVVLHKLPFHNGVLHGMAHCYASGKLTAELAYHNGVQHGVSKMYDLQGRLVSATSFHEGEQHGLHIDYHAETGAVMKAELYAHGALQAKGRLETALETGASTTGAFEAGLREAHHVKVGAAIGGAVAAKGRAEAKIGGGLGAKATGAIAAGAHMKAHLEGLASAAAAMGAKVAASFNIAGGVYVVHQTSATIKDHIPFKNILPFCLCKSPSNPEVAAATAANKGKLTPMPCKPNTMSPWIAGSPTVTYNSNATLTHSSTLMCAYAGVISIKDPLQNQVTVP